MAPFARTRRTGSSCASNPPVERSRASSSGRTQQVNRSGSSCFPRGQSASRRALPAQWGLRLALQIQLMAASAGEDRSPSPGQPPIGIVPASEPPPPPPIVPAPAAQIQSAGSGASDTNAHPGGPSLLIGAGAAAGLGLSSDPAALGRLFVTLAWSHFAVELAGEVSLPSTTHLADGTGFSQEQFLAGLAGCGVRKRI